MSDIKPKTTIISQQRRQLLKLGLFTGASGALAIATGSATKVNAAPSRSNPNADVEILNGAIALEQKAINVAVTIMPVESMHAAVFRTVLMAVLKEKGLPMEDKIVPYSFLSEFPTPPVPMA